MLGPRRFPPAPRAPRGPRDWVRTPVVWGAVGNLNFAVFAMAVRFVDAAVVAAISQLWTLLNVLLLNRLGRLLAVGNHRPHRIAPRQALLAGVAFAGAVLVVFVWNRPCGLFGLGLAFLSALLWSLAIPVSASMGPTALRLAW